MNPIINQIFDQALDRVIPHTWTVVNHDQLLSIRDEFAELLIRECAKHVEHAKGMDVDYQKYFKELLLGVEEPQGMPRRARSRERSEGAIMGSKLSEVLAALPELRQQHIEALAQVKVQEMLADTRKASAIHATALDKQEEEPVTGNVSIGTPTEQPERCSCGDRPKDQCPGEWEPGCDLGNNPKYVRRALPLYTHPPRMEWVSLTDDEISAIFPSSLRSDYKPYSFARAIEQALKERNT